VGKRGETRRTVLGRGKRDVRWEVMGVNEGREKEREERL